MKQKKLYKVLGINTQNPFNPLLIFAESNHTNTNHIKQNQKRNQGGKIRPGSTIAVSIDARQSSGRWSAASGTMVGDSRHRCASRQAASIAVSIGNRRGLAAIVRATDGRSAIHRNQGGEIRPGSTIAVGIDARRSFGRWSASMRVQASGIDRRSASGIVAAWRQSSRQRTDDRQSIATRAARFVRDRRSRSASTDGDRPGDRRRQAARWSASAIVTAWRRWSAASGAMVGIDAHPGKRHRSAVSIGNRRDPGAIVRATDGRSTTLRNQGGEIRSGSTIAVGIDGRQSSGRWSAASGAMVGIGNRRDPGAIRPTNGRTIDHPSQPGRRDSSGIDDRGRHRCAAIVRAVD